MSLARRAKAWALAAGLAGVLFGGGCGLDAAIFHHITGNSTPEVPGAGQNFIAGRASLQGAGATVRYFTAGGTALPGLEGTTAADGTFLTTVPATNELQNAVVEVQAGPRAVWGLVPRVRAKTSVFQEDRTTQLGTQAPVMADLGVDSTLATLVLLGQARYASPPVPLSALDPEGSVAAINELTVLIGEGDERVVPLREMVNRLLADGASTAPALRAFPPLGESFLDLGALSPGHDYTGDGVADASTDAFEGALAEAVGALSVGAVCFPTDRIRVVMMVDFNEGNLDRNCAPIDRFKWVQNEPGRQMFIVGSLHEDTPNCGSSPPPCLDTPTFVQGSQQLGNWTPNTIRMYDDGTNGDLVSGDNVWTATFDMPWFDAGAPERRWVRMHYKYTWGVPGQLWTTTEEWPGNSRLLELRDLNGDGIITRYDLFGDETTNKGVANLLGPTKGGCGVVKWLSEDAPPNCVNDTFENMIDTTGDCVLDTWPPPGSASPLTVPCAEVAGE